MSGLSEFFMKRHPEMEWRAIINLRNIVAHDYGKVDPELLWEIVTEEVPKLKEFCEEIIG